MKHVITARWWLTYKGDDAFVNERVGEGSTTRWGPVPADLIEPLVIERRNQIEKLCQSLCQTVPAVPADVMELVDMRGLKPLASQGLRVRPPSSAPSDHRT